MKDITAKIQIFLIRKPRNKIILVSTFLSGRVVNQFLISHLPDVQKIKETKNTKMVKSHQNHSCSKIYLGFNCFATRCNDICQLIYVSCLLRQ